MAKPNYFCVGSNKLEEAKAFYDALLGSIDIQPMFEHPSGGRVYGIEGGMFAVLGPFDQKEASVGNGSMVGFQMDSADQVATFHNLGLALGGSDEGVPGERFPGGTFGYFRDLDGNKLCAYHIAAA